MFSSVKTLIYLGDGGAFNTQTGPILVHIYPLIYIKFICQIWKQSDKNLLN